MILSTKNASRSHCLHTFRILPKLLKASIRHDLFKQKTKRSGQVLGQQSGKAVLTGLKWHKDFVLHHVIKHTEMPQRLANVSNAIDVQGGIAYTSASGVNQLYQNGSELLRQAPESGVRALLMV